MLVDEKNYPLTKKWSPLAKGFSGRYKIPEVECIQELYLVEWQLKDKRFKSPTHRENYFKKVAYRKLKRLVRNTTSITTNRRKHLVEFTYIRTGREADNLLFGKVDEDFEKTVDSIIQLRPFDEIYYEELVTHVVVMLSGMDLLAARLFTDRMKLQLKWKELRLQYYKSIPHNRFYQAVQLVKKTVKREVCNV